MGARIISLHELLTDAAELNEEGFLRRHATPYLVVVPIRSEDDDEWSFVTALVAEPGKEMVSNAIKMEASEMATMVFAVRKEGIGEANLVTIGRTKTSDIRLDSPAISKLHAYFSRDPVSRTYTLTDAGSTNGTVVAGQRLLQGEPVALDGGEEIELAGRFRALFIPPERLLGFLRQRLAAT